MYICYDNRAMPSETIASIVGQTSFADIVYRKNKLQSIIHSVVESSEKFCFFKLNSNEDISLLTSQIRSEQSPPTVLHLKSSVGIKDIQSFKLFIKKIPLSDSVLVNRSVDPLFCFFPDHVLYLKYLNKVHDPYKGIIFEEHDSEAIEILEKDFFFDLRDFYQFINFFSGSLEARYFNKLESNPVVIKKSSNDIKKIKKEYTYYQLLPEEMKPWFVLPYNYKEDRERASYTMHRYRIPDMAIQWIHSSISQDEFQNFLTTAFSFINSRIIKKSFSLSKIESTVDSLFIEKVRNRLKNLKEHKVFSKLEHFIVSSTDYPNIEAIYSEYYNILEENYSSLTKTDLCIGHGDFCFSNILYDKKTNLMRLIDPKGALNEEELYTHPLYDIAKLSHSIIGNYDFINNLQFEIITEENLEFKIDLKTKKYTCYKELFLSFLQKNKFDPYQVRLIELSLFLSMLPLHTDSPKKILGFLLNAVNILEELKANE